MKKKSSGGTKSVSGKVGESVSSISSDKIEQVEQQSEKVEVADTKSGNQTTKCRITACYTRKSQRVQKKSNPKRIQITACKGPTKSKRVQHQKKSDKNKTKIN